MVTASRVVPLQKLVWDGQAGGLTSDLPTIDEVSVDIAWTVPAVSCRLQVACALYRMCRQGEKDATVVVLSKLDSTSYR